MTEQELVEKVAIAISGAPFPTTRSLNKARAALSVIREALREPTPAMLGAAWNADELHCKDCGILSLDQFACGYDHWKAMIAASPIGEK